LPESLDDLAHFLNAGNYLVSETYCDADFIFDRSTHYRPLKFQLFVVTNDILLPFSVKLPPIVDAPQGEPDQKGAGKDNRLLAHTAFFARFFGLARFSLASSFSNAAFDTVNTILSALLMRSVSVLPGTAGGGRGFI